MGIKRPRFYLLAGEVGTEDKKQDKLFCDREFLVIITRDSQATTKTQAGSLLLDG